MATATQEVHGAIVFMPDELPDTEDGLFDVLGPVSEVLQDAEETLQNVLRAVTKEERLSHLQAGALMLRAAFYKEIGEGILDTARRLERITYEQSLYGPAE
jgi:hypothetical protein